MPIALALLAALSYGAADFFGGLASRRTATVAVAMWSQGAGFLVLACAIAFLGGAPGAGDLEWGIACGAFGAIAVMLLYRGLAIGTMGIVSPVTAVLAAIIPVIYGVIARNEHPTFLAALGIVAALIAVVCVSIAPESAVGSRARTRSLLPLGMTEAIGAGALFGALFVALAQIRAEAGMYPLLLARVASVVLLGVGALLFAGRTSLRVARPGIPTIFIAGALDMGANVLYLLAIQRGSIAIVAVLTSLYPAGTVALAGIVLRERLGTVQWIGVAIALGGVLAISAGP